MLKPAFSDRHFYSPIVDLVELDSARDRIWPDDPPDPPGIDFRPDRQRALLREIAALARDYDYPQGAPSGVVDGFREPNGMFEGLDARMSFCLLRRFRPRCVIEVGCGFSSLLAADVNTRFLRPAAQITCIDPFPPPFLTAAVPGIDRLVAKKVQDVPLTLFEELEANDILFIDSSHVVKTGSDVTFLHLEVLPRLREGVVIHIHDIFLPEDYPKEWVLGERRSWSEQYLVRALLTYSCAFEVVFANHYAALRLGPEVRETFGGLYGGGSLWIRRTADRGSAAGD
jgi:hypothetical protein